MFFSTTYWIIISLVSCSSHAEDEISYKGAQVWRTDLRGTDDILVMKRLIDNRDISVWKLSPDQADYLVYPEHKVKVHQRLRTRNLKHTVLIMDVQRRIEALEPRPVLWDEKSLRIGHRLDFKSYPTLKIIDEYFNYLSISYPSLCRLQTIGRTAENRTIQMLNISNGNPTNKVIILTAGSHSREWVSITSALYIVNDIVTNFDQQPNYIKNKNWLIIPVVNPDGYVYSHIRNRLWRKNRSGDNFCKGVDINRNFETDWAIVGITVNNQCDQTYAGPFPFSEAESIALRNKNVNEEIFNKEEGTSMGYLHRAPSRFNLPLGWNLFIKMKKSPSALVDLHAYGQLVLYPWSSKTQATHHANMHRDTAQNMTQAIFRHSQQNYTFGPTYHMIYPATGALIDWAYSSGTLQSFAIEARDGGAHGFLLPAEDIEETGMELLTSVRQLAKSLEAVTKGLVESWF